MTTVLFAAIDGTHGDEIWVTDGFSAGTFMIDDIKPGALGSDPFDIASLGNGKAVFRANDGTYGYELWVTDGTPLDIYRIDNIRPGSPSSYPAYITAIGHGKAVFAANDGTNGDELWVTNGTPIGTYMVKDINPGSGDSNPKYITAIGNGDAVFVANDGTYGNELWVTDGYGPDTQRLADINPGSAPSNPNDITALGNGKAVFHAFDGSDGTELWVTDGTVGGTQLIKDINPGSGSSYIQYLTPLGNGKAIFEAHDGSTTYPTLWVTDGTSAGTYQISYAFGPGASVTLGNGMALFSAHDTIHGNELWITDGTAAGTSMVADLRPGTGSSNPGRFASLGNGKALFVAIDDTHGEELWITDGTAPGTYLLKDINPGGGNSLPYDITGIGNGEALFSANDGTHGYELWYTDGTTAGTRLVDDINPGGQNSSPFVFTVLELACYRRGTMILTPAGEVPVENLAIGDGVVTLSGEVRPVRWIGRRHVNCTRHLTPDAVWPVRIGAGALGSGRPFRDLFLSPDHALFIDGVLIPVRYLVNGKTIRHEPCDAIEYWHVELAEHDVLYADGAPAESYLDTGNRGAFANGGAAMHLHPDFALGVWETRGCAPLVLDGPRLASAKRRLLGHAHAAGHATTGAPNLRVLANGKQLGAAIDGQDWRIRLPRTTANIRLVSRIWTPAHVQPASDDTRPLGVAISRLRLDRQEVALDSHVFAAGWHTREPDWCWTNGDASLEVTGARELSFRVTMTGTYWRDEPVRQSRTA